MKKLTIFEFRVYTYLFYSDELGPENVLNYVNRNLATELEGEINFEIKLHEVSKFPYRHYNVLATLEINFGSINSQSGEKPLEVFESNRRIKEALTVLSNEVHGILVDDLNLYPYALIIASGINGEKGMLWTPEKLQEHKQVLGSWIEYYSGHWDDYSSDLFNERLSNNLSNRLSELHFIRSNSAFIYIEETDPESREMTYMEQYFVNQILTSKAVLYVLMLLNNELDEVSNRVRGLTVNDIATIDKELKFIENLQLLISEISSDLNRERLMNRLHHSTKVINECFRVFSLDQATSIVDEKIQKLQNMVKNLHDQAQNRLQNQQKRWILILNGLIGSQVAFTIKTQLVSTLLLFSLISTNQVPSVESILDITIWILLGSLIMVTVIGLSRSFLKARAIKSV
jgi:hypothetical protein